LIFETLLWARGALSHLGTKSVKDPGNTIKVNPRLARTVPPVIYFSLDIYRGPTLQNLLSNIKVDI
jgi:hypothetical protein